MQSKEEAEKMHVVELPQRVEAAPSNPTKKNWGWIILDGINFQMIFVITCVMAAITDPLFFYIPSLYSSSTCLSVRKDIRDAAIICRVFTDIPFIFDMIYQIRKALIGATKLSWHSFIVDLLAILPIPQLLVVYGLATSPDAYRDPNDRMWMSVLVLAQYIPRMYIIFALSKTFRKNSSIWIKGGFYFAMYIVMGHIVGSFMYYNTVLTQLECWYGAICTGDNWEPKLNCQKRILYCSGDYRTRDPSVEEAAITRICTRFTAYGMFTTELNSNSTQEGISLRVKDSYFVLWGLKNLSNFGTNFETSFSIFQNLFAIIISGMGLVMFAYFIGHMQEAMQSSHESGTKAEKVRKKEQELQKWMKKHGLNYEANKKEVRKNIRKKLEEDKNTEIENLQCLPESLHPVLCMRMVEKVPALAAHEIIETDRWKMICCYLKPVMYKEREHVFQVGKPLDRMLFIVDGSLSIYNSTSSTTSSPPIPDSLRDGDVYGAEPLMSWASPPDTPVSLNNIPISTENVTCLTKVEGFTLTAKDLKTVLHLIKHRNVQQLQLEGEVERSSQVELTQLRIEAVPPAPAASLGNPTTKKWGIRRIHDGTYFPMIFIFTCVMAACTDPLFFYIPSTDVWTSCLSNRKVIRNAAIICRAFTDIPFIFDMIYQIRKAQIEAANSKSSNYLQHVRAIANKLSWCSFTVDLLAILPLPQLLVAYELDHGSPRGYGDPTDKQWMSLLILAQYILRIYVIFASSKTFRQNSSVWFKIAFYFVMYILIGHIVGGFMYYNTILKQLSCWYFAYCDDHRPNCKKTVMYCVGDYLNRTVGDVYVKEDGFTNASRLAIVDTCMTKYDYGMFATELKSPSTDEGFSFRLKLTYFLLWGLKNLSNFGTSLDSSFYTFDNLFAISISGMGLVMFAYLIGHMQQTMQSIDGKKAMTEKVKKKEQELQKWMKQHLNFEASKKELKEVRKIIRTKLEEDKNTDLENLHCLPESLHLVLCMTMLNKVSALAALETTKTGALKIICGYLKPVIYKERELIFQVGEPLDRMLFIVDGSVIIYNSTSTSSSSLPIPESLGDGGVYGAERLMSWALPLDTPVSRNNVLISTENVICHTKVEGFALTAKDLKIVLDNINNHPANHAEMEELVVERSYHTGGTPLIHGTPGSYI